MDANPDFHRSCFEAFATLDAQIVVSVGRRIAIGSLGAAPANVLVRAHVPQLDVLQRAGTFVTHGCLNSGSEGFTMVCRWSGFRR